MPMEILKQFKALSDPTRIRLLNMLNDHELNVNEIVSIVGMIQSGVSRHLKILMESGLLVSRKEGSFIYYSAARNSQNGDLIRLACERAAGESICREDLEKAVHSIDIRKNRSKRFFKTVAPQWDRLKKEVLGKFDLNRFIQQQIVSGSTIADLGCGTGELLLLLHQDDSNHLIGVDSSPEMLEQAKLKLYNAKSLELRLGEVEYLPMKDQEIDTVIMSMVLYHIIEPEKALKEIFRVLKPGGAFILADFEKHDQEKIKEVIGGAWLGFEAGKLQEWLRDAGFEDIKFTRHGVEKGLSINIFSVQKGMYQ
ncbi:MAG: metalloregulator ArsR/SmtB family transcription factor [Desulfobacterales bacterium]|nr:metalloregulator ArsR/SmtB family transcription factor [Desulfobacterales bacterium]